MMKKTYSVIAAAILSLTFSACDLEKKIIEDRVVLDTNRGIIAVSAPTNNQTVGASITVGGTYYNKNDVESIRVFTMPIYGGSTNAYDAAIQKAELSSYAAELRFAQKGYYYVWAEGKDVKQRIAQAKKVFFIVDWSAVSNTNMVDKTAPVVTITSPAQNQSVGSQVTFRGNASDSGSGVKAVYVRLDSESFRQIAFSGTAWQTNYSLTTAGSHTMAVYATDISNNVSVTNVRTVDYVPGLPSVSIVSPVSGLITNKTTMNVAGTASVDSGSITLVELKVNGGSFADVGNTTWNKTGVTLTEGTNTLTAKATSSAAQNATSAEVKVICDTTAPSAAISSPTNNQLVNNNTFTVSGTASDTGVGVKTIYIAVNSGFTPLSGTASWTKSVSLPDGAYTIKVYSVDNAGNCSVTNQKTITVAGADTVKPTLAITSPVTGASTTNASIIVSGTASDNKTVSTVYVILDTEAPSAASGTTSWNKSVSFSVGSHTVKVYAVDDSGNVSATNSISVSRVATGGMTVYFKKPSTWTGGVYIHYWPNGSVWANCPALTDMGGGWYYYTLSDRSTSSLLFKNVSGTNVTKQSADLQRTGNGWYYTNNIWYDSNPEDATIPTMLISGPADYREVSSASVNVFGSANGGGGITAVKVKVNAGGWQTATGTTSWNYAASILVGTNSSSQTNTIQVYAIASSGHNSATNTIHVVGKYTTGGQNHDGVTYSGKLGANKYNNGTEFSIWWRGSVVSSVSVTGSFNGFTKTAMTRITSGANQDVWWVFVPGVGAGEEYKFVGRKGSVDVTVADPWARYNRYSSGNSVVVNQSTYSWQTTSWTRPAWSKYIIYELHVKDFTSAASSGVNASIRGKYLGITNKLTYLTNLGVTAIELMPVSEFPDAGYSWGYNTSLFLSLESGYATAPSSGQVGVDEFKALVDTCHKYGVAVIIDMVFNHTANNDNWLWQVDEIAYFDYNNNGVVEAQTGGADSTPWGNRLCTWKDNVKRLGKDTIEYFMNTLKVDGFRFDATHTYFMDHGFIRDVKSYATAIDPNVYFVYENLPNESDLKTYGAQWADGYHDVGMNALCGWSGANANTMSSHIFYNNSEGWAGSPVEALNYVESHDEDTLGRQFGFAGFDDGKKRARTRLAAVMLGTSLGNPMLWMGQEFLRAREGQNINELALDWSLATTYSDVLSYYQGIFKLRRDNPALRQPTDAYFVWRYTPWDSGHDANVVGYSLTSPTGGDKKFVVVLNFDLGSSKSVWVGFPEDGTWKKVASESQVNPAGIENLTVSGGGATVTVGANSGVIYMK